MSIFGSIFKRLNPFSIFTAFRKGNKQGGLGKGATEAIKEGTKQYFTGTALATIVSIASSIIVPVVIVVLIFIVVISGVYYSCQNSTLVDVAVKAASILGSDAGAMCKVLTTKGG